MAIYCGNNSCAENCASARSAETANEQCGNTAQDSCANGCANAGCSGGFAAGSETQNLLVFAALVLLLIVLLY